MKKAIIKLLAGLLAVSLVSGCGAGVSQKTPEKQILKWALSNMNYDMTPYEEVLNEKLEEKGFPYEIQFESIQTTSGDDTESYVMAYIDQLGSGNYDIVSCPGTENGYDYYEILADRGNLAPWEDWLEQTEAGKKLKESYPEIVWDTLRYQDHIYGAATPKTDWRFYAVFQQEYAEQYGLGLHNVTFDDMEQLLECGLKEKEAQEDFVVSFGWPYYLQNGYEYTKCQLVCADTKQETVRAESILENEEYQNHVRKLYRWKQRGMYDPEPPATQIQKGNFLAAGLYSYGKEGAEALLRAQYHIPENVKLQAVELPEFQMPMAKKGRQTAVWGKSDHQDSAFQVIAAIYSDRELTDALVYGKENEDYQIEDGKVVLLNDSGYFGIYRSKTFGNPYIKTPGEMDSVSMGKELWEGAEQAKLSKQIGIHWDDSELNRVISTINTEFMADGTFLLSGTGIDYEEELKELEKEMEALGLSMVTERMNQIFRKETGV